MTTTRNEAPAGGTRVPTPIDGIEIMTDATTTPAIKIDATEIKIDSTDGHTVLIKAYTDADAGMKTKIRNAVKTQMDLAVRAMDIVTAKIYMDAGDAIKSVSTKTPEKVDYNRVVADRVIALRYAAHLITMGDARPDGVPTDEMDLDAIAEMIKTYTDGDADAVSDDVAAAGRKIANTKITKSTARDDIADKINSAVAAVPVGTFLTVAMIQKSSGAASGGAIAARLWPVDNKTKTAKSTTLDLTAMGIKLDTRNGVRGVTKINESADATDTE